MDELLRELIDVPGVSGYEDRVRELIASRLPPGTPSTIDAMGNLVATIGEGGDGPTLLFVAHMDEIGFLVSEVRDDGFVKLKPIGGIDPRTVFGRSLRIVTSSGELTGVCCVVPPHLMADRAAEMARVPGVIDLFVDIGAGSRAEAEALGVSVLDFAVLHKQVHLLNDKYMVARSLDDRIGCYVLLKAIERMAAAAGTVHVAFSVQEEVGLRGADSLARRYDVDQAFAVDTIGAADFPEARTDLGNARLGAGPALRMVDTRMIASRAFGEHIRAIGEAAGVPVQMAFAGGGTDAQPFQPEDVPVVPITVPARYTHSAVEMVHLDDVEGAIKLVCAIVDGS